MCEAPVQMSLGNSPLVLVNIVSERECKDYKMKKYKQSNYLLKKNSFEAVKIS